MIESKDLKINRVNISLTNQQHINLKRLAISLNIRTASLGALLVDRQLSDMDLIKELKQASQTTYIEGKGLGNKKINRVNLSLTDQQFMRLKRLSISLNIRITTLAALLIEKSLSDVTLINELQQEFTTQKAYKIVPIQNNGELKYALTGREDL